MEQEFINNNYDLIISKPKELTITSSNVNDLPKYWDKNYINQNIENIQNYKHKIMMQFLWMTGARISEVVTIRKKDLDFKNYVITIRWLKNRKYNYRNIPLHPKLKDLLEIFTAQMNQEDKVFNMSRQRAWTLVKRYMNGHPHQFRHSFAVNWLRNGGDVFILSRMMGHSRIDSTMEYLKIVPLDQGKELLKIQF